MSSILPTTHPVNSLRFGQHYSLASQEGKAGRPRKCGRVVVRNAVEGTTLDLHTVRAAVAAFFGQKPTDLAHYAHEITPVSLTFRVPGLDKDTGITMDWLGSDAS